ncbi:MAG: hypothetical protein NTW03_04445, partial [Verrucomicrobia bacterium]|nr:hypothetical protein [Verrucomicrobiota bacterium]
AASRRSGAPISNRLWAQEYPLPDDCGVSLEVLVYRTIKAGCKPALRSADFQSALGAGVSATGRLRCEFGSPSSSHD